MAGDKTTRPMTAALRAVHQTCWAVLPGKLYEIIELLEYRAQFGKLSAEQIEAVVATRRRPAARSFSGGIALVSLMGVVSRRQNMMTETSGGTSLEQFSASFNAAMNDDRIGLVAIEVDSPGGDAIGGDETSKMVFDARARKPVVAIINGIAASLGYYIASSASEVVITPTGQAGSIGVISTHTDMSAAMEQAGEKTTIISAGDKKAEGSPFGPLSEVAAEDIQKQVNLYYDMFVRAVARNRSVTAAAVRGGFGNGGMVGAVEAKSLGMVDRIEPMDVALAKLVARQKGQQATSHAERRLRLAKARQ